MMRHASLAAALWLAAMPSFALASSTIDALLPATTQTQIMMGADGPNACGYRARFVANDDGGLTVGDVNMIASWSERHETVIGLLKFRVERYLSDGKTPRGVSTLSSASISTNNFAARVAPAAELTESPNDPGYYIAPSMGLPLLSVMLPEGTLLRDNVRLIFSFRDADRPAQESIRYEVKLSESDAESLAGCLNSLAQRHSLEG